MRLDAGPSVPWALVAVEDVVAELEKDPPQV